MSRKWSYFAGAAILAAYFLMANGVPPLAVAAGISGAAAWLGYRSRSA